MSPRNNTTAGRGKSIMHTVKKLLIYDVIHLQPQPAILCSNDAKSCYDRIVHSVASIPIQLLGMPAHPMKCMIGKFQDLEHHIRTAYSPSESCMHNDFPVTFQCIYQGNESIPTILFAVSAPLLGVIQGSGHGIQF